MTRLLIAAHTLCLGLMLILSPPAAAQARFVSGTEDLPLMAGLDEIEDAGLVFDTPAGRLVEARAEGVLAASAVRAFYAETLPQLGWQRLGGGGYVREGEILTIDVSKGADTVVVYFALTPETD